MMIEPARPAEVERLATLVNGAYRGEGARRGWTHEAALLGGQRTDATMLRDMLATGTTLLVARQDQEVLGCVAVAPSYATTWTIGMLTVSPDRQAEGHGATLLHAAERWIAHGGGTRATMTVIQTRDTLIAWYARRGFVPTGATAPFPYGDTRFGEPLRADLSFVVLEKELMSPA